MKILHLTSIASIVLATAALVVGLRAAQYWLRASKVEIVPVWPDGAYGLVEPGETEASQDGWIAGTIGAVAASSELNKSAARWTAAAVILSAVSSVFGAFGGSF
jgi:hypothetical protein